VWILLTFFYSATIGTAQANGKNNQSCFHDEASLAPICARNANPTPIPTGVIGAPIDARQCASTSIDAFASLYAYDDQACHPAGDLIRPSLEYEFYASTYLPKYSGIEAEEIDLRASVYCDRGANVLVLAYRGTAGPRSPFSFLADWYANVLQHIGRQPNQYGFSSDVVEEIEKDWKRGVFDGKCGSGRPRFVLTGHSKGGGQAQFAAKEFKLDATVFNSDLVNPVISADPIFRSPYDMLMPDLIEKMAQSVILCRSTELDAHLQAYMSSHVRDVRMTNDPLALLLHYCNFPHAPIEWLIDTSACSASDGHGITSIIRELQTCAAIGK
jgi:hypothetical protein